MAKLKYEKRITADTESNNTDGSLYLLSTYDAENDLGQVFYDLETFYNYLETLGNVIVYIHNFGGWDSYFLFNESILTRYKVIEKIARQKKLVSVTLQHIKNKKKFNIKLEDSLPRATLSLKAFAKSIGEAYEDLPDYDAYREPNHPEKWADRKEIEEYAIKDVKILWKLVENFRKIYGESFDKSLSAGTMVWKEVVKQYSPDPRWAYKNFRKRFTPLSAQVDANIRTGYMGGITTPFWNAGIVLDKKKLKELYPWFKNPVIKADDISSAYAWAQVKELPNGRYTELKSIEDVKKYLKIRTKVVFFAIRYSYTRAKFPLIPKLHMMEITPYTIHDEDGIEYTYNTKAAYMETMLYGSRGFASLSSIDLKKAIEENVYENFNYEIIPFLGTEDIYGISFDLKKSKEINEVTMKYYELKNNAPTKALRFAYKQPLVNIYGKTGERYYEDERELDIITREYIKDEKLEDPRVPRFSHVATAATITSYVHHKLYDKGKQVGFKNMLYCDTDSMFFVTEDGPQAIETTVLGTWDNEVYNPDRALFICAKKYIVENKIDGVWKRYKWASAGILKTDERFNIDEFMSGRRLFTQRKKILLEKGLVLRDEHVDITPSFTEGDGYLYSEHDAYE